MIDSTKNKIKTVFLGGFSPYFWLILITTLLYFRTIFFGTVGFADDVIVNAGIYYKDFFKGALDSLIYGQLWGNRFAYYRPGTVSSFLINMSVFGNALWSYHLFNIIFQSAAVSGLYILLKRLSKDDMSSFLLSVLFSCLPALSHSVAWFPGRIDIQLTVLIIASFYLLTRAISENNSKDQFLGLIFFVLALLTKENSVMLALVLPCYLLIFDKEKLFSKKAITSVLFMVGVVLAMIIGRSVILSIYSPASKHFNFYVLTFMWPAVFLYFGKIFSFFDLKYCMVLFERNSEVLNGFAVLAAVSASYWIFGKKDWRPYWFGILWFVLFLLPSLMATDIGYQRLYLPSIGVFIILSGMRHAKYFKIVVLSAAVLYFINTASGIGFFQNTELFWVKNMAECPNSADAHQNLSVVYFNKGDMETAFQHAKLSIEKDPLMKGAHNALGVIYMRKGMLNDAMNEFNLELANNAYPLAHINLGIVYESLGKNSEAREEYLKAYAISPNDPDIKAFLSAKKII